MRICYVASRHLDALAAPRGLPLDGTIKSARDSICLFQDFLTGNSYDQEKKTGKQEKGKGNLYGKICFASLHHL